MDNVRNLSAILKAVHFKEVYNISLRMNLCTYAFFPCAEKYGPKPSLPAGVHVLLERPGPEGDRGAGQMCPGQRLHPGQPLPTV